MALATWWLMSGPQTCLGEPNVVHLDFFNASGSGKYVKVFAIIPVVDSAADSRIINTKWQIWKTTSIGIGGTAHTVNSTSGYPTIASQDTNETLSEYITARNMPDSGATAAVFYGEYFLTTGGMFDNTRLISTELSTEWSKGSAALAAGGKLLVFREQEGIKIIQTDAALDAIVGWKIGFLVDTEV
jgi:hypothetical protein